MMNHSWGDQAISELGDLVPEGVLVGCSFAGGLPSPDTLPSEERPTKFLEAQNVAVEGCLRNLLKEVGIESGSVLKDESGQRLWPAGFVGSVTHKATVVGAVLAPTYLVRAIGIDIELLANSDGLDEELIMPEGLPVGCDSRDGIVLGFSIKESVFKAQFPLTSRSLGYSEVRLSVRQTSASRYSGSALCSDGRLFAVRAAILELCVVSCALLPAGYV